MIGIVSMPGGPSYDFMSAFGAGAGIDPMAVFDSMGGLAGTSTPDLIGIDPQLVGTPATSPEDDDDEADQGRDGDISTSDSPSHSGSPPSSENKANDNPEKLTLLIQPVKVGGKGKARKGTVQTGGIIKKSPAPALVSQDKENITSISTPSSSVSTVPEHRLPASAFVPTNIYPAKQPNSANEKDDDDDLPHDWRPPPEVFQKMSSKEKRQLRNKISARNFRVRRKGGRLFFSAFIVLTSILEYISTLEGDIAERDRLLDAIRSELGSTQSENYALRQEIATLKRVLLDGRGNVDFQTLSLATGATPSDVLVGLNLPPPAPLPAQSAAETILAQAQTPAPAPAPIPTHATAAVPTLSPSLLMPNIHKDVSSSSSHFWGGASASMKGGMRLGLGGVTPVHRVVMPEMAGGVMGVLAQLNGAGGEKLQENMNPMMNQPRAKDVSVDANANAKAGGFDGYVDGNVFTMKTMDAYRMHLWGKMATMRSMQGRQQPQQQQQQQQQQQPAHLTGLASWMRPAYFSAPTLGGKHAGLPAYPSSPPPPYSTTPPLLPVSFAKHGGMEKMEREKEREREREKEREVAMAAALASQTLLKKLGGAFWDAFVAGGTASSTSLSPVTSSSSLSSLGGGRWDAEKVRKVLEGKAVVRVVDVDESDSRGREVGLGVGLMRKDRVGGDKGKEKEKECLCLARACVVDLLEESMRSLSVGKK